VDQRTDLDGSEKTSPPPEFDPRTVKPVASRYIDRAIPAHNITEDQIIKRMIINNV
jgi:hypothetical protein